MNSLQVLDVTLRDGGCVNNFNFGQTYMEAILSAQEAAGIEYIELGYIDEVKGTTGERTQYLNEQVITQCILKNKKSDIKYVAMIDYGKFDVQKLQPRCPEGIDGIRLAFHKKNMKDIIELGRVILEKGYELFIQPMITLRYTDTELLELIAVVNQELSEASAFYIVDSFGEMRPNDISRIMELVDKNLAVSMSLGFHSHNNLQLSYSNAISMLQYPTNRNVILDSSIMGMGKGAGNLNTELLLEYLNAYYNKNYKIEPLLQVMDEVINQIHTEFYWGYAPEYYLSAVNHCTPNYASYFYNKHMLPIEQVNNLLSQIPEEKKISFDQFFAEELYRTYNEAKVVDDSEVVEELRTVLRGRTVLLVAPGKRAGEKLEEIEKLSKKSDLVCIGLNTTFELQYDYLLTTRKEIYEMATAEGKNIIAPSNIVNQTQCNVKVINYKNWIEIDDKTYDSSSVMIFKLLQKCGVTEVLLAGFDGFSLDINENYAEPFLRRPVTAEQAEKRNLFYKRFFEKMRKQGMNIEFVTKSLYE